MYMQDIFMLQQRYMYDVGINVLLSFSSLFIQQTYMYSMDYEVLLSLFNELLELRLGIKTLVL